MPKPAPLIVLAVALALGIGPGPAPLRAQAAADFARPLRVCRSVPASAVSAYVFASDNETAYLRTSPTEIRAVSLKDLALRWHTETPETPSSALAIGADGTLFEAIPTTAGVTVRAYDRLSGLPVPDFSSDIPAGVRRILFEYPFTAVDAFIPLTDNVPQAIVYNPFAKSLRIHDLRARQRVPSSFLAIGSVSSVFIGPEGLFLVGTESGRVTARDASGILWELRTGGKIEEMLAWENFLVVFSADNFLYVLDLPTGDVEGKVRTGIRNVARPKIRGDLLFLAGAGQETVLVIDLKARRIVNRYALDVGDQFLTGALAVSEDGLVAVTGTSMLKMSDKCDQGAATAP